MPPTDDAVIARLLEQLRDPSPIVRRNAASIVRLRCDCIDALGAALATLLDDDDPRVRSEAARALRQRIAA